MNNAENLNYIRKVEIYMNYRSYVGTEEKYDLIGANQFNLLTTLGLREHHKYLDIGCGSLRSGRLFIPYLNKGNYCGIEPEKWLIDEGINNEIGVCMVHIKAPRFEYSHDFPIASFGEKFNFIIAHSIFTHASQEQILKCLKGVEQNLVSPKGDMHGGLFAATFILGDTDYQGTEWVYPGKDEIGFARYTEGCICRMARESNLACKKIDWTHPNNQTWIIFGHESDIEQLDDPTYRYAK